MSHPEIPSNIIAEGHEDNTELTNSTGTTLDAPGVYDADKQLTSQQIVDMKELFKNERGLGSLACQVVARITGRLIVETTFDEEGTALENSDQDEPIEGATVGDIQHLIHRSVSLGASWQEGLSEAIGLPGDEWPVGMTPPATFAEELKSEDLLRSQSGFYDDNLEQNPEFVARQVQLYQSVTGRSALGSGGTDA